MWTPHQRAPVPIHRLPGKQDDPWNREGGMVRGAMKRGRNMLMTIPWDHITYTHEYYPDTNYVAETVKFAETWFDGSAENKYLYIKFPWVPNALTNGVPLVMAAWGETLTEDENTTFTIQCDVITNWGSIEIDTLTWSNQGSLSYSNTELQIQALCDDAVGGGGIGFRIPNFLYQYVALTDNAHFLEGSSSPGNGRTSPALGLRIRVTSTQNEGRTWLSVSSNVDEPTAIVVWS